MASTDKSSELTLTNSQNPGFGLMAKATCGGMTTASCKSQAYGIENSVKLSFQSHNVGKGNGE